MLLKLEKIQPPLFPQIAFGFCFVTPMEKVVAPKSDNPRWIQDMELSTKLFEEAGVVLELL